MDKSSTSKGSYYPIGTKSFEPEKEESNEAIRYRVKIQIQPGADAPTRWACAIDPGGVSGLIEKSSEHPANAATWTCTEAEAVAGLWAVAIPGPFGDHVTATLEPVALEAKPEADESAPRELTASEAAEVETCVKAAKYRFACTPCGLSIYDVKTNHEIKLSKTTELVDLLNELAVDQSEAMIKHYGEEEAEESECFEARTLRVLQVVADAISSEGDRLRALETHVIETDGALAAKTLAAFGATTSAIESLGCRVTAIEEARMCAASAAAGQQHAHAQRSTGEAKTPGPLPAHRHNMPWRGVSEEVRNFAVGDGDVLTASTLRRAIEHGIRWGAARTKEEALREADRIAEGGE